MTVTRVQTLRRLAINQRLPSSTCSQLVISASSKSNSSAWYGHNQSRSLALYVSAEDDRGEAGDGTPPLVAFRQAQLQYASPHSNTVKVNLAIAHPTQGGHVLLGVNGSGKTLFSNALSEGFQQHRKAMRKEQQEGQANDETADRPFFRRGHLELCDDQVWHAQAMAHVSFESHEELIAMKDEDTGKPLSVQKAIASGGALNRAAQFLVVRFGMFPLLHRSVTTLSTGEIRKVLIIKALANRPRLLVLDNAFDGLDVPSRTSLKELASRILQGFKPDILVQAVDAKATAHTQVLLITHRAEEVVDPITKVTYLTTDGGVVTEDRDGRTGDALLQQALGLPSESLKNQASTDATLPSTETMACWWRNGQGGFTPDQSTIVSLNNLTIQRGDATLLENLTWDVQSGQHWWIAGGNGAGKSSLSRLLARYESGIVGGSLDMLVDDAASQVGDRRKGVGWVSTESHMALARSTLTVHQVLTRHSPQHDVVSTEQASTVLDWLDLPTTQDFLQRRFHELSQGEQKLVLIAAAMASQSGVLVLDEPCQGLDWIKRQRVLGLVERLCQAVGPELCLIYITHHPEEVIPSISHVLHLAKGQDVFQGTLGDYDADAATVAAAAIEWEK